MRRFYPIPLEFGDVCDLLTIYQIKYNHAKDNKAKQELGVYIRDIEHRVTKSAGLKTYHAIIRSEQYNSLYEVNQKIYDAVNIAKKDKEGKIMSAYQLDQLNVNRNKAKRALNYKFLGEESSEVKLDGEGERI